jgi:hypothetical protein
MNSSYYNIHDFIGIRFYYNTIGDGLFIRQRLRYFESIPSENPSIVIYFNVQSEKASKRLQWGSEQEQVLCDKSRRRLGSWSLYLTEGREGQTKIVFYGNKHSQKYLFFNFLEPIINYHLTKHNACMVHASSFVIAEKGYLINAFPSSGKTTILLKMLDKGADYLSDEMTIIMGDGRAFSYPTPVSLYDYNITHKLASTLPKRTNLRKCVSSIIRRLSGNKVKLPIDLAPISILNGGEIVASCKVTYSYVIGCQDSSKRSLKRYLLDINRFQYRYFDSLLRKNIAAKKYLKMLDYWSRMESIINLFCETTKTINIQEPSEFNRQN